MNTPATATVDATNDTTSPNMSRHGVALRVAADRLGVSLRTVQRRVAKGNLPFIERDGERFVLLEAVATPSATSDATPRQNGATHRDTDATPGNLSSDRESQYKEEIRFLRGLVEQRDRDAAELRAALREALRAMPKQLAAPVANGNQLEQVGTVLEASPAISGNTAKPANGPQMNTNPTEGAVARNSGTQRQEPAPSTYGELADLLESQLGG
ncbi:hypothetical protein EON83_27800 [bacterium]|nr:MAG: hypothetical protein EON83_27800 [bacterium]